MAEAKVKSVVWSNKSTKQLKMILDYLLTKSEFAFLRVSEEIINQTNNLSKEYNFHPIDILKHKNDGSHRACFVFHYRISYKVDTTLIKITSIRHTSRIPLEH